MKPGLGRVGRAGIEFVAILVPMLCLYIVGWRSYEPVVFGTANAITAQLSPPTRMDSGSADNWRCFAQKWPHRPEKQIWFWAPIQRHVIFIDLPIVVALLLATPATWRVRLRLAGLGVVLAFAGHVVAVVASMRAILCVTSDPQSFVCVWALKVINVSGQLLGAAIWVLLAWRYWFPGRQQSAPPLEPRSAVD